MPELLQDAIRVFWEIMLLVSMPWRASLIIFVAILFLYHVGWRLLTWLVERLSRFLLFLVESTVSLLLLPEYWITKQLREHGRKPLPGSYTVGDILQGIVSSIHDGTTMLAEVRKRWRLRKRWVLVLIVVAIPISLWYVRPYLEHTTAAARYIDQGVAWWYSIEERLLSGD